MPSLRQRSTLWYEGINVFGYKILTAYEALAIYAMNARKLRKPSFFLSVVCAAGRI